MNEQTLKLLEKALLASPDDWETRAHLIDVYLEARNFPKAAELLRSAPAIPDTEADGLRQARVELEVDSGAAQQTLERILARNKACAEAYLLFARVFKKRGLMEEGRRKYGAATVIDESIHDEELETWLGAPQPTAQPVTHFTPPVPPSPAVPLSPEDDFPTAILDGPNVPVADIIPPPELPRVTFADIGGMEDVIERIRMNIIYPFKNPEVFKKFNKKPGGGILMYGPPGCGKTHIARATAGECNAAFISIAITDVLSHWLGESEQHLHALFENARRRAPVVVFIDEIDAIGGARSSSTSSMAPIVNVLLTEMDGMNAKNDGLMVLAATNTPWRVDDALRRPGRFDRVLFVPPPDAGAREAILKICLRAVPAEKLDLAKIAKLTNRFSGADLRAIVERASEKAIFNEMRTGKSCVVTQAMLLDAVKETRASTNEWLETARSYASYANKSGLYDDLVSFFEKM